MRRFWNPITGDLVETGDEHTVSLLLADGYVEVSREGFMVLADVKLEERGQT